MLSNFAAGIKALQVQHSIHFSTTCCFAGHQGREGSPEASQAGAGHGLESDSQPTVGPLRGPACRRQRAPNPCSGSNNSTAENAGTPTATAAAGQPQKRARTGTGPQVPGGAAAPAAAAVLPAAPAPSVPAPALQPARQPSAYDMMDVLQPLLEGCGVEEALLARLEVAFPDMPPSQQRYLYRALPRVAQHEGRAGVEHLVLGALRPGS